MAEDPFKNLQTTPATKELLAGIAAEVNAAYRENFESMLNSLSDIAEGQKRLLSTLGILIKAIEPKLGVDLPVAIAIAMPEERPDVASALVLADPEAAGYTLAQNELANKLGLSEPDVSILTRAFRLEEDASYALQIRVGKKKVVKYRPTAGPRLLELIGAPPSPLSDIASGVLKRVRKRLQPKS